MAQQPRLPAPFLGFVAGPVFAGTVHVAKYSSIFYPHPRALSVRQRTQHCWTTRKGRSALIGMFSERSLRKQAVKLFLHDLVALAHASLKAGTVQNDDLASAVVDQPGTLQVPC